MWVQHSDNKREREKGAGGEGGKPSVASVILDKTVICGGQVGEINRY